MTLRAFLQKAWHATAANFVLNKKGPISTFIAYNTMYLDSIKPQFLIQGVDGKILFKAGTLYNCFRDVHEYDVRRKLIAELTLVHQYLDPDAKQYIAAVAFGDFKPIRGFEIY